MSSISNTTEILQDEKIFKQWANLYEINLFPEQKEAALRAAQEILRSERQLKKICSITNPLDPVSVPLGIAFIEILQQLSQPHPGREFLIKTKKYWIPIASNFGMWKIRFQLEDSVFRHMDSKNYQLVLSLLKEKNRIHQELFENIIQIVDHVLKKQGIRPREILYRKKNTFGIYEKMRRKQQNINHINDLFAVRVIVNNVSDCYKALNILHYLWPPYPERFKDYIKAPKPNGYQSLHTVLHCLDRQIVEFQIRTQKMDYVAKFGPASHALYKKRRGDLMPSLYGKARPSPSIN